MRRFAIVLFACILYCVTDAQTDLLQQYERDIISPELYAAQNRTTVFAAAPTGNYDMQYVRCEWFLNPDTTFISGRITSYFKVTEDASEIYFDCSDSLIIDSVVYHGLLLSHVLSANALKIELPVPIPANALDSVAVIYHGNPSASGFGSFAITPHATANTIWTLSEPYGASDWWPCKQTLDDKIDSADVIIKTPVGFTAGGPGLLEISTDGTYNYCHWKTKYPVATYLIGVAVSNYVTFDVMAESNGIAVPITNMVYPEDLETAIEGVNAIVPSFEMYADKFGDYPYAAEKYGHMQFGWGGGMEHQTMSSVSSFGFDLLNHEMAHQWFGDKITCASWRDIWLNEGFATYCSWLCYDFSDDPFHYFEAWLSGTRNTITSKPNGSVWCDDTSSVSRIFDGRLTYYKGAWLLHMLRGQIGDEAFFTGVKNYITDPALEYGFAHTDDFIEHMETAADTALEGFFADWFYGQGFPSYQLLWEEKDNIVSIAVSQTPSDASVDFFEMKVPVRLKGDADSLDLWLPHQQNGQVFTIPVDFEVKEIILDPAIQLLHAGDTVVQVKTQDNVISVCIFPDPAHTTLNIQLFEALPDQYRFRLLGTSGDLINDYTYSLDAGMERVTLDVSSLASGVYYLWIQATERDYLQKFVVQ